MAQVLSIFPWVAGSYYFEQPWTLNDISYNVTVRWNSRESCYYLDLVDATDVPLVQGIPLRAGRNLIGAYQSSSLPSGKMFVFDTTGADQDPGLDSMGITHALCFLGEVSG